MFALLQIPYSVQDSLENFKIRCISHDKEKLEQIRINLNIINCGSYSPYFIIIEFDNNIDVDFILKETNIKRQERQDNNMKFMGGY